MINIYFAGAIRGGRQDSVWYKIIIEILGQHGHVFTEHVGSENLIYGEKGFMIEIFMIEIFMIEIFMIEILYG